MKKNVKIKVYSTKDFIWPIIIILLLAILFSNLAINLPYGYLWALVLWCLLSFFLLCRFIVSRNIIINHEAQWFKISGKIVKISDVASIDKREIIEYVNFPSNKVERLCFILKSKKKFYFPCRFMPSTININDSILAKLKEELNIK